MAKGARKRRQRGFKLGHSESLKLNNGSKSEPMPTNTTEYIRPSVYEEQLFTESLIEPEALEMDLALEKPDVRVKLLRNSKDQPSSSLFDQTATPKCSDQAGSYKILHTNHVWNMVNTVFREHGITHPSCIGNLNFDSMCEEKRSLVWRERAICNHCDYTSRMFNLYNEVDTGICGRKSADINMMVHIGMTQTTISATSLNKILLSAGLDAPSVPGLQKTANKVNPIIENANQQDMKSRKQLIKIINLYKNKPENQVSGECDAVYNNSLYSGVGRTPFQPATQAVLPFAENETVVKQILAIQTVNKLCSKHGFHSLSDEPCNNKSGQCTATALMETNIGDEQNYTPKN